MGQTYRTTFRYLTAVALTAAAGVITAAAPAFLEPMRFFFFWCAVLLTAVLAGTRPAILAVVLGTLLMTRWLSLSAEDLIRMAMFAFLAGAISVAVGARREAQDRARISEEWLRTTLRSIGDAVIATDTDGRITFLNTAAEQLTGWAADAQGTPLADVFRIVNEETGNVSESPVTRALRENAVVGLANHTMLIRRDGTRIAIEDSAAPIRDQEGGVAGVVLVFHDVSDKREAERVLAGRERQFRNVVETVPAMVWVADTTKACTYFNSSWLAFRGRTLDQERGLGWTEGVHPDERAAVVADYAAGFDRLERVSMTYRIRRHDGGYRWIIDEGVPRFADDGTFAGYIGACIDITEQKRAADAQHILSEATEKSIDELPQLLAPAFADRAGIQPDGGREPVLEPSRITVPIIANDAVVSTIVLTNDPAGYRFTSEDLAHAVELARRVGVGVERGRALHELQEANRSKDDFLAMVSHELRTPLTAVMGWARLLQIDEGDEALRRQALDQITRSARVQNELIEDILDVSRIAASKLHLESAPLDLSALVEEVVASVQPVAQAKHVPLLTAGGPEPLLVSGDERRLRQSLVNVINNAIKFTDAHGSITVARAAIDGHAEVRVVDTGRGIDPAFLPRIWERFTQADAGTRREHGGLGLGLALTRSLIELHGGTIEASSGGAGKGATFTIRLPLVATVVTMPEVFDEHRPDLRGRTILILDDEEASRIVLTAMLEQHGAQVLAAETADDALRLLSRERLHAIVTDLAMPDVDGYQFARQVRARGDGIPIIAVTALGRAQDGDGQFAAMLRKPLEPLLLARTVAAHALKSAT